MKIGIIVNSASVPDHIYDLIRWCKAQDEFLITEFYIQKATREQEQNFLSRLALSAIAWFESLLLRRSGKFNHSNKTFNLHALIPNSITITAGNAGMMLQDIDLILMFGCGSLSREIIQSSRLGVLAPKYSDQNLMFDAAIGFWEVYGRQKYTDFSIQHECRDYDGKYNIIHGNIMTQYHFLLNRVRIVKSCNHYLMKLMKDTAAEGKIPKTAESSPIPAKTQGLPGIVQQTSYGISLLAYFLGRAVNKLFQKEYTWNVGYQKCSWDELEMQTAEVIPNPVGHFLADPFVLHKDGKDYCFVEDYDFSRQKGHISVYELFDGHAEKIGDALDEPFHLSFPFLFEYDSEIYMCPEACGSGEIRVYKSADFPLDWKLHSVIMENTAAVDTVLFELEDRWWLLTSTDETGIGDYYSDLRIFWADSPLSKNWHPHPGNSIYRDAGKSRNAGFFMDKSQIYRPSQRQGFAGYPLAYNINRIDCLTETEFQETLVKCVDPDFFKNLHGAHHIHSNGIYTTFDFLTRTKI